jgi:hypothetical protein
MRRRTTPTSHFALVLPLARAVFPATEQQDHRIIALQLRELAHGSSSVAQFEIGQHGARNETFTHWCNSWLDRDRVRR